MSLRKSTRWRLSFSVGRDVVGRAPDFGRLGVRGGGDAEVEELGRVALVEEDVLGLDVAVDEVRRGGELEAVGDVHADLHDQRLVERLRLGDHLVEVLAADELHHDVGLALLLAEGVDLGDVGVVELGGGLRLAAEGGEELRRVAEAPQHHLDGDDAGERLVVGAVDAAHAAAAEAVEQQVVAQPAGHAHLAAAARADCLREGLEGTHVDLRVAGGALHAVHLVENDLRLFSHWYIPFG